MQVSEKTVAKAIGPWQCGRPLCSGEQDSELRVVVPRCSQCTTGEQDTELSLIPEPIGSNAICQRNLRLAKSVVRDVFAELETQCRQEQLHYETSGLKLPCQKSNVWDTYMSKARVQRFMADAMEFLRHNAECRSRVLTEPQLRFLVLLQHFVSEDTSDFQKPEAMRKHHDAFEGILTDGVNSQLVKDLHRSDYSVDGQSFSLSQEPSQNRDDVSHGEEQRRSIARLQTEFITALETFLLEFSARKGLSSAGTRRLVQAVSTQMSQAGLANLERGSQASRFFVGSQGLDQRTAYNLSTMDDTGELGESLKLTILCMKTGFCQYLEKDEVLRIPGPPCIGSPKECAPSSYLYQYCTLRFVPGPRIDNCESTLCCVLDALDEAHIDPRDSLDSDPDPDFL
mmetsp:Transcript_36630/g.80258  ORF Transcript_36630/g.80258 Transcript_36630/m.80258 type:complete len:398 (+) Transcript_36630:121-1314(+)